MKHFYCSNPFFRAALAFSACAALALSGCDLFDSKDAAPAEGVSGLTSPWIGQTLDSLTDAKALAFRDGRLYVTNRHATLPGTAVVDTATGVIVEYYPHLLPPAEMAFTATGALVVTEGSFGADGAISVIHRSAKRIRQSMINFDQDNMAVAGDGRIYLIDRTFGVVTGFTGDVPGQGVVLNVQTGPGSNPQGIAIADGKAWIPRYDLSSLLILGNPNQIGGGNRDSLDLSAYAHDSAGGIPRMSLVAAYGGHVFVALQRLDHQWTPHDTALVLVIDAATGTVEDTLPLTFRNPVSGVVHDGTWYIAGVGTYGDLLGGVEKIDLATRTHAGIVTTEQVLGGDLSAFTPAGNSAYAVISVGAWPNTRYVVKKFAP